MIVIRALQRLGIDYMVAGSMAVFAHGVPRGTRDSDLVVALRRGDGARIAAELGTDFYFDVEMTEEAIRRHESTSAIYTPALFKVDLFALKPGAFDHAAFQRRRRLSLGEGAEAVFVQSPEDVIISKLKWYRLGGEVSDLQWRDVLGVLKLQGNALDRDYLRKWAEHERVLDLLDRAERDAA